MTRTPLANFLILPVFLLTISTTFLLAAEPKTQRLAAPDQASQNRAEKLVRDVFAPYPQIPAEQRTLVASKLIAEAQTSKNDPAAAYVLLKDAAELSAAAGDIKAALDAITELANRYTVNADDMRLEILRKASTAAAGNPNAAKGIVNACLAFARQAAIADKYDIATRCVPLAETAARGSHDPALLTLAQTLGTELRLRRAEQGKSKLAEEKLAKHPEDPDANLALGRYLCLIKENWQAGLPMLVKTNTAALKSAAASDLAAPSTASAQIATGDLWWDLGEKETSLSQAALRRRAAYWYEKALADSSFTGLTRARAEKRLASSEQSSTFETPALAQNRNVLHFQGHAAEGPIFKAVAGKAGYIVARQNEVAPLVARPNPFAKVDVFVWGGNRFRDLPPGDFPESAQLAMQNRVRAGADLVIFEQFAGMNTKPFTDLFGIKITGDDPKKAQIELPALAAKLEAGKCTADVLKEIQFNNAYEDLPKEATILVRGGDKKLPTVAIVPFGSGRLILIGTNYDGKDKLFNDALLDFIYNYGPIRTK
jgi:hypothetical protein